MIQQEFARRATEILNIDDQVIGLAAGGSWLTREIDAYSDLDLVLVTKDRISHDKDRMLNYAKRLGNLLSGFTGEHVGEPRVLICLYDDPLLHVDIKFVTLEEFEIRVEDPAILLDKNNQLQTVIENTRASFPQPNFQWIEDRFWIWVHYILQKIGRGEYMEALDSLGFLRMVVFGPLLHVKNGNLPRGVRKVEMELEKHDLRQLVSTIPLYDRQSLLDKLRAAVSLYTHLREELYDREVKLQEHTRTRVMQYLEQMEV
ncbi:MAG: aminoglycoside 6-adenylyltransferase [Saprospiraceae bacterium]|nr:aminoglycoside 6-adenylyltransferase [Saprospiraceae bacterium]